MARKIAVVNNKGGSAKTTSVVNIAGAYSSLYPNKKVLIVETDGQGNATRSFNLNANKYEKTMYDVFLDNEKPEDCIINVHDNIDLIPANSDMNFVEFDMMANYETKLYRNIFQGLNSLKDLIQRNLSFKEFYNLATNNKKDGLSNSYFNMLSGKFDELEKEYDLIIFDTPPEIKAITSSILSILTEEDSVIIPFEPDAYSIDGVVNILDRIELIKKEHNPHVKIGGVMAVKVQNRTVLHGQVKTHMMKYLNRKGIYYFETEIPNSIRFASSTSFKGLPATLTQKDNNFVKSFYDMIVEMEEKNILVGVNNG